jgi:hypothetical protein
LISGQLYHPAALWRSGDFNPTTRMRITIFAWPKHKLDVQAALQLSSRNCICQRG